MGTQEIFIPCRKVKDALCERQLQLLLIVDKPLDDDTDRIFASMRGFRYLKKCYESKFACVDTYITSVINESKFSFTNDIFPSILEKYHQNKQLDLNNFAIAFIGEASLTAFEEDIKASLGFDKTAWIRRETNQIKIYNSSLSKNTLLIKYVVLPAPGEDLTEVPNLLNSIYESKVSENKKSRTTGEMIAYFVNVLQLYNEKSLDCIEISTKVNPETKKTIYLELEDSYNRTKYWYLPNDEVCKSDTIETRKVFGQKLKEVLTTIPVYNRKPEKFEEVKNSFEYYAFKDEIQYYTPVEPEPSDRPIIVSEKDSLLNPEFRKSVYPAKPSEWVNGTPSTWYMKWHKDVLLNKDHPENSLSSKLSTTEKIREGYTDNIKYEWIYDIEVFKEDWLFVAKSLDGKHIFKVWNDGKSLAEWIHNKILIGFNNAAYDDVVIRHAMAYPYIADPSLTVKKYSDTLILDERGPKYPQFKKGFSRDKVPPFLSWDINFHMPFDIRRNSLKKLTMSVLNRKNYDSSVPFDIDRALTPSERVDVEKYCEMDVDNTLALFLPDPENPKRTFARDSYDIRWNLIVEYGMQAKTLINKSSSFAGKVLCGENTKPNIKNTFKMVDGKPQYYCIPELAMKELAGTPLLQFYLDHQSDPNYIHEKFELYMGGNDESHKYQFGFGGLHQAILNYGSQNLTNMDVASLYPSLLVQYGLMSRGAENPESYEKVYHTRLAAKKEGKKLLNEGLKLILNGAIGAMLSEFNPLFDTWSNSSICVHGQLLVYILAKRLFDAGLNIIQTNTDGIMIETKEGIDHMAIAEQWMKETRLVLEFDEIAILQQNNVNNYYCEFKNGKIKSKGFYLSNEKFGKATSKILCNIVTNKPLFEGVEPRDYVIFKRHSVGEIYDGITKQKLEGRSLAFVVGYESDSRTQSYYSRSRNERQTVKKDEKGKPILDITGKQILETVHSESKITGFTDHMLLVDDINTLTEAEINRQEYVNFAKNLLDRIEDFGPYYNENFMKMEEPALLQALNPLKDNTEEHPTKSGVVCQNFLFESDCISKEEQEEMINNVKDKLYRVVWSGNKSYHCIVRIDRPVTSLVYKKVWYYLQHKLKFYSADTQCAVPSKYTRVPNQVNPKTGNLQTLYSFDKNILKLDEILADLPKISEEIKPPKEYTGKVTIEALQRHINRQDWSEGNRFAAVQKLSPKLIAQVTMDELLKMIPCPLEKDHRYVLRAKYSYYRKYIQPLEDESESY